MLVKANRKTTLTIGIPALNEEKNIESILLSLFKQVRSNFRLKQIIVICDGSSDETPKIVKIIAKKKTILKVITHKHRKGKNTRVNEIIKLATSDALLLLDADIVLSSDHDISKMITRLKSTASCCLVGARHLPVMNNDSFQSKVLYTNYLLFSDVHQSLHGGDSIYNVYGSAMLMSKKLYSVLRLPPKTTCDTGYIYGLAQKIGMFKFARNTFIYQTPPQTFAEFRKVYFRTNLERDDLTSYFGNSALSHYDIPVSFKIKAVVKHLLSNPVFTISAVVLNLVTPLLPYQDPLMKSGQWEQLSSTKQEIKISS